MPPFLHETRTCRVRLENGCWADLPGELDRLGVSRILVVTTPRGSDAAADLVEALGAGVAGVFDRAKVHVPSDTAEAALGEAQQAGADVLVAPGGGSAIGVAKAVAMETALPIVALPTTYSGSEMTSVWGITGEDGKRTGRSAAAAPRVVLYDPSRTLSLPPRLSALSGMNAVAHAVEALYAPDRSPLSCLLAEEGIRTMARFLPRVVDDPVDVEARTGALCGAHLCGWALDLTSMGLQHKLAHVIGGSLHLPHALVHAILLPHVVAYNEGAAPEAMDRIAGALEGERAAPALFELNRTLGITDTLEDLGLTPGDLDRAAEMAVRQSYPNPARVHRVGVQRLLQDAWEGRRPC